MGFADPIWQAGLRCQVRFAVLWRARYAAAGLDLLRRSYHLRAALGARPQTAAAAATLADALPPGNPERDHLLRTAAATARELGLTWLNSALGG